MTTPEVYLHDISIQQIDKFSDLVSFKCLDLATDTDYSDFLCISYIRTLQQWQNIKHCQFGLHIVIASSYLTENEIAQIKDVLLYRQASNEDVQQCLDLIIQSLVIYQRQDQFECTCLDFSDLKHLISNTTEGFGVKRYALDEVLAQPVRFPADFKPQDSDKDATVLSLTLPQDNTFKITHQIIQRFFMDSDIGDNHQIFYALRLSNDEILNGQHNDHVYLIYRKSA